MKHFAVLTTDLELVLDIVGALEAGGHHVELADEAAGAMKIQPTPDALIVDAGATHMEGVRAWADREGVALVMVGPEGAAASAERMGAGFIERPAGVDPSIIRGSRRDGRGFATDPEPMWPLILLDTLESAVTHPNHSESGPPSSRRPEPIAATAKAEERPFGRASLGSVLVVEDDDANRSAILEILSESGFTVMGARDGIEALEVLRARSQPPQAILVDLMMPRMNGWELQKALGENPELSGVPVVVISALAPATELTGSVAAQLHKPLDLHELVATVESVVDDPSRGAGGS